MKLNVNGFNVLLKTERCILDYTRISRRGPHGCFVLPRDTCLVKYLGCEDGPNVQHLVWCILCTNQFSLISCIFMWVFSILRYNSCWLYTRWPEVIEQSGFEWVVDQGMSEKILRSFPRKNCAVDFILFDAVSRKPLRSFIPTNLVSSSLSHSSFVPCKWNHLWLRSRFCI